MEINKRGQFYLVAAVIIAIAVFSLVTISNYAKPQERKTAVFDIGNALNFEVGRTVAYTQMNKTDTWGVIENFAQIVMNSSENQNIESWFIVYGDPNNMTVLTFSDRDVGDVRIDSGGGSVGLTVSRRIINKKAVNYGSNVNITFNNITYNFDMQKDKNFAFLIKEENYVTSSSDVVTSGGGSN